MLSDPVFRDKDKVTVKFSRGRKPISVEGTVYVIFSKEAKLAGILIMINSNIQTGKQTSPTHSSVSW